jgi:hypothetical protein
MVPTLKQKPPSACYAEGGGSRGRSPSRTKFQSISMAIPIAIPKNS